MPDDTTLIRWARLIQPATMQTLPDHVTDLARQLHKTNGRKLRLDGTVVEAHTHHPSDNTLLNDGVRVMTRLLGRVKQVAQDAVDGSVAHLQETAAAAKTGMKRIMDVDRQKGEQAANALKTAYGDLVQLTETVVAQARQTLAAVPATTNAAVQRWAERLEELLQRLEQFLQQTTRRVLQDESVPAMEKIVSLFAPRTAILRKGKPGKPVMFGRMIWLAEVEGGIITHY